MAGMAPGWGGGREWEAWIKFHSRTRYPLTWFWQPKKSCNFDFGPRTRGLSLLGSRDKVTLAKERSSSPMEGKMFTQADERSGVTTRCHNRPGSPAALTIESSQFHDHPMTIYRPLFSPNIQGQRRRREDRNLSVQGRALASVFSRWTAPDKLYTRTPSEVGKEAHIHKGCQRWSLDKKHRTSQQGTFP